MDIQKVADNAHVLTCHFGWATEANEASAGRLPTYVRIYIAHHIAEAWNTSKEDWAQDKTGLEWLTDLPGGEIDAISSATGSILGHKRCMVLAEEAENGGHWWTASARWAVAAHVAMRAEGMEIAIPLYRKCAESLLRTKRVLSHNVDSKLRLQIHVLRTIIWTWDPVNIFYALPTITELANADVAREDAAQWFAHRVAYEFPVFLSLNHNGRDGNEEKFGIVLLDNSCEAVDAAVSQPEGSSERAYLLCLGVGFAGNMMLDLSVRAPLYTPERVFGKGGERIIEAASSYNFRSMSRRLVNQSSIDTMLFGPPAMPLLLHWGDIAAGRLVIQRTLMASIDMLREDSARGDNFVWHEYCCGALPFLSFFCFHAGLLLELKVCEMVSCAAMCPCHILVMLGMHAEIHEVLGKLQADLHHVDDTMDGWASQLPFIQARGAKDGGTNSAFTCAIQIKVCWLLAASSNNKAATSEAQRMLESLPDAETVGKLTVCTEGRSNAHLMNHTSLVWIAMCAEKYGRPEQALDFAQKALDPDCSSGGDPNRWVWCLAHCCRARVLAASEESAAAARSEIKSAVQISQMCNYPFLEALALSQLHYMKDQPTTAEQAQLDRVMDGLVAENDELSTLMSGLSFR